MNWIVQSQLQDNYVLYLIHKYISKKVFLYTFLNLF